MINIGLRITNNFGKFGAAIPGVLKGRSNIVVSSTGVLSVSKPLAGTSAITINSTGNLSIPRNLSGTSSIAVGSTGNLTVDSGAFLPTDITNCAFWLDADDDSTLTYDGGGLVESWVDKVASVDCVQTTALNKPIRTTSAIGGKVALDFRTSRVLQAPAGVANYISSRNQTIFMVHKLFSANVTTIQYFLLTGSSAGSSPDYVIHRPTMRGQWRTRNAADSANSTTLSLANDKFVNNTDTQMTLRRSSNIGNTEHTDIWRVNGVQEATQTATENVLDSFPNLSLQIGAATLSGSGSTGGYIGEIIVYKRDLSDIEIGQVENYLATKWSL